MKPTLLLILLVFVILLLIGCSNDNNDGYSIEDIQAIEAMSAARAVAFNEGDAPSIAIHSFYRNRGVNGSRITGSIQ